MILFDYPISARFAWAAGFLLCLWLLWRLRYRGQWAGLAFPEERLAGVSPGWRARVLSLPTALRVCVILLLFAALARPQLTEEESAEVEGIDIVVALDLSGSMSQVDLSADEVTAIQRRGEQPRDRFQNAVAVLSDFIRSRRYDRVSLITFGRQAFLQFPLTLDYGVMLSVLEQLRLGDIDGSMTVIGDALARSLTRLEGSDAKTKLIILITDGDDVGSRLSPLDVAAEAKRQGVPIFPILVGREGESLQPTGRIDAFTGAQEYQRVENSVNPELLRRIARETSGGFYRAVDRRGLEEDLHDILNAFEKSRLVDYTSAERRELFPELLWLALALLALELLGRELLLRSFP